MANRMGQGILGLSSAIICVALGCSTGETTRPPGPPSQSPSDNDSSSSAIANSIKESTPFESLAAKDAVDSAPDDQDELFRILARKEFEQKRASDKQEIYDIQMAREQTASRLLRLDLNREQRYQAVRAKLDALLRLTGMGDSNALNKLQSFAKKHAKDNSKRIAQSASLALLVSDMTQRISASPAADLQPVIEQASMLADRYSDSLMVCRELLDLAEGLLQLKRRDEAMQIMVLLLDKFGDHPNEDISQLVASISQRLQMVELNFDAIMNEFRQNRVGAIDRYQTAVNLLVIGEQFDQNALREITRSLQWLEYNRMFEAAWHANQIVHDAAEQIEDAELKQALQTQCAWRTSRLRMLNRPFQFEASTAAGQPLDWEKYQNKVVLAAFWSTSEPSSLQRLRQLSFILDNNQDRGLALLAINLSPDLSPLPTLFGEKLPPWDIAVSAQPAETGPYNHLAEKFGVDRVPYVVLINRQGKVVGIDVPRQLLQQEIDKLLPEATADN